MPVPAPTKLAERIQSRLADLDLSARGASLAAGLGPDAIRIILKGRSRAPNAERLLALARALKCDVAYLLGAQEDPGAAERPSRMRKYALDFGSLENGRWFKKSGAQPFDRSDKPDLYAPAEFLPGYKTLLQFALVLLPPVQTKILPMGSRLHFVQEISGSELMSGDIVLLELQEGGFYRRQIWKVVISDEIGFRAISDGEDVSEREDIEVAWHADKTDRLTGYLSGPSVDSQSAVQVELLGRAVQALVTLDKHVP